MTGLGRQGSERATGQRAKPITGVVASVRLVRLAGPLDVPGSLEGYRRSGDDLLDRWDGAVWLRALPLDGRPVAVAARPARPRAGRWPAPS